MSTTWDADRFKKWVAVMEHHVRQREAASRLVLLALCARTHVLLLGPPGTGKSLLANQAKKAMAGRLYSTLLTKFSVPEDVVGPLSIEALNEGRYERLTDGYLPTADLAFIDEVYKANAAILNAMLSILNERLFFDGNKQIEVPLRSMVAASNEVPEEDEGLDALDDRLLLRISVEGIDDRTLYQLVRGRSESAPPTPVPFDNGWLAELHRRAEAVRVTESAATSLLSVLKDVRQKVYVSDRRVLQIVDVLKHMAALDDEVEVLPVHLGLLRYALWRRPEHRSIVDAAVDSQLYNAEGMARAEKVFEELKSQVERSRSPYGYSSGGLPDGMNNEIREKVRKADEDVARFKERRDEVARGGTGLWNVLLPSASVSTEGVARRRAELVDAVRGRDETLAEVLGATNA